MEGLSKEFENVLTLDLLSGIVGDAGGDRQQFARCLEDQKYKAQVDEDFASSEQEGATATPTFIIDGQKIVGAQPITLFRPLLEEN
jgi:predicted DsbA family dithiol-disulfide isomerase